MRTCPFLTVKKHLFYAYWVPPHLPIGSSAVAASILHILICLFLIILFIILWWHFQYEPSLMTFIYIEIPRKNGHHEPRTFSVQICRPFSCRKTEYTLDWQIIRSVAICKIARQSWICLVAAFQRSCEVLQQLYGTECFSKYCVSRTTATIGLWYALINK